MASRSRRGLVWELQLMRWHDSYRMLRRGVVWKTNPPTVGAPGRMSFRGDGPPDFIGVCGGRTVVFDAKETSKASLPFSQIAAHQAMDLHAAMLAGAASGLCVSYTSTGDKVWVWWSDVWEAWSAWHKGLNGGRASIAPSDGVMLPEDGWVSVVSHNTRPGGRNGKAD